MGCVGSSPSVKYVPHDEAVIITCYFNPKNSFHRYSAFNAFYKSIKHCNHRIIECAFNDNPFELYPTPFVKQVRTNVLLFHKEALLNILIKELPPHFKYVFWIDGDILFTNKNWLVESVQKLQSSVTVIQPFEYSYHLEDGEVRPSQTALNQRSVCHMPMDPPNKRRVWKSFGANVEQCTVEATSLIYDCHGHVGFAWGIRRSILTKMGGLYDRALIGGADHIIAHAIMTKPNTTPYKMHECVDKSHWDPSEKELINQWSLKLYHLCGEKLGYVPGDVYHLYHGQLDDRNYYLRIFEFSPFVKKIVEKDANGLYITRDKKIIDYVNNYFDVRETKKSVASKGKGSEYSGQQSDDTDEHNVAINIGTTSKSSGHHHTSTTHHVDHSTSHMMNYSDNGGDVHQNHPHHHGHLCVKYEDEHHHNDHKTHHHHHDSSHHDHTSYGDSNYDNNFTSAGSGSGNDNGWSSVAVSSGWHY